MKLKGITNDTNGNYVSYVIRTKCKQNLEQLDKSDLIFLIEKYTHALNMISAYSKEPINEETINGIREQLNVLNTYKLYDEHLAEQIERIRKNDR